MAHKVSKIILNVDLGCPRCYKKIKEVLCTYRERCKIEDEIFDDKNNTVTISGPFCPLKLMKKLCCKAGNVIKSYKIVEKEPPKKIEGEDKTGGKTPTKGVGDAGGKTPTKGVGDAGGKTSTKGKGDEGGKTPTKGEGGGKTPTQGRGADPQLVQQIVVYCGPSGYVPHPPCHCGCGGSQQLCSDGCGRPSACVPAPPCHCGCGGSQQQCSDGCGGPSACVPAPPCHCGCGGQPGPCYCGCERRSCQSPCEYPNACIVM